MGETVGEESPEVSRVFLKELLVNLEHFDTNLSGAGDCGFIISTEKPTET